MRNYKRRKPRKPRNLQALAMILRSTSSGAAGKHANHDREVQKGWRRHPKHRTRVEEERADTDVSASLEITSTSSWVRGRCGCAQASRHPRVTT